MLFRRVGEFPLQVTSLSLQISDPDSRLAIGLFLFRPRCFLHFLCTPGSTSRAWVTVFDLIRPFLSGLWLQETRLAFISFSGISLRGSSARIVIIRDLLSGLFSRFCSWPLIVREMIRSRQRSTVLFHPVLIRCCQVFVSQHSVCMSIFHIGSGISATKPCNQSFFASSNCCCFRFRGIRSVQSKDHHVKNLRRIFVCPDLPGVRFFSCLIDTHL